MEIIKVVRKNNYLKNIYLILFIDQRIKIILYNF